MKHIATINLPSTVRVKDLAVIDAKLVVTCSKVEWKAFFKKYVVGYGVWDLNFSIDAEQPVQLAPLLLKFHEVSKESRERFYKVNATVVKFQKDLAALYLPSKSEQRWDIVIISLNGCTSNTQPLRVVSWIPKNGMERIDFSSLLFAVDLPHIFIAYKGQGDADSTLESWTPIKAN
jgi:hypothetical protein